MESLSRREFLYLSLAASANLSIAADAKTVDVHRQILEWAARQEEQRRARFAAVKSKADLDSLQKALRHEFLRLLDGFPEKTSIPPVRKTGQIEAEDYVVEKLAFESFSGCVGNSGGGTLTAYIAALDPRVAVAAICCYITTLPRRMGNRIQTDPDADPEQDIFGFVSRGIDHAGLLALLAPRPTLLGTARFDFFPIEGAKESFAEAKRLYEVAGAGERIDRVEAAERHGLSLPLRQAVYAWFDRWLAGRTVPASVDEVAVTPRPAQDLLVCTEGQVNRTFGSRPLLPLALEEFRRKPKAAAVPLKELLCLDMEQAAPFVTEIAAGTGNKSTTLLCINGNEARDWRDEQDFLQAVTKKGHAVVVVDPRGVGRLRPVLAVKGHDAAAHGLVRTA